MTYDMHVAAIAALTLEAPGAGTTSPNGGGVAAAVVRSRQSGGILDFSFHVIARASVSDFQTWADRLIADDPLLVGYRLGRISRLLRQAGFDRNLAGTYLPAGRVELADYPPTGRTALSVSAILNDVMAVDQEALVHATSPIPGRIGASLALINAAASWVIWFRRATGNAGMGTVRDMGLTQLRSQVRASGNAALIAAIDPTIQ